MDILLFIAIVTWPIAYVDAHAPKRLPYCENGIVRQQSIESISRSEILFGLDFYKQFYGNSEYDGASSIANIFIGPSKLRYGAKGETERYLRNVLKLDNARYDAQYGYQDMVDRIEEIEVDGFVLAHEIFYSNESSMEEQFENITSMTFRSVPSGLNFTNEKEFDARISEWYDDHTENDTDPKLKRCTTNYENLIFVSSSYVKNIGLKGFGTCNDGPFFNGAEWMVQQFMGQIGHFNYGKLTSVHATFLEVPFETSSSEISMFVILPEVWSNLARLERDITNEALHEMFNWNNIKKVRAILPKFSIAVRNFLPFENYFHLSSTSKEKVNLSGITKDLDEVFSMGLDSVSLRINAMDNVHCPDIDSPLVDIPEFKANQRFMFVIAIKDKNPIILFMGHFTGIPKPL